MKKSILLLFVFIGISCSTCFAEIITTNAIIIKTSQQRLLCETMTKNYLMIASEIKIYDAKVQMNLSSILFEKNLNEISIFNSDSNIIEINNKISNLWKSFSSKIVTNPETSKSLEIMELSMEIQNAYIDLEKNLKLDKNYVLNEIQNLCSQQIYNTEKIAKICIAKFSNTANDDTKKEFKMIVTNFENTITLLLKSKTASYEFIDHLKNQIANWIILRTLIIVDSKDLEINKILNQIDSLQKECNLTYNYDIK
jgi:hypothetical protein